MCAVRRSRKQTKRADLVEHTPRDVRLERALTNAKRAIGKALGAKRGSLKILDSTLALYRTIGETLPFGIWVCQADGKLIYLSDSFLKMIGMSMQEWAGGGWMERIDPDQRARLLAAWKRALKSGQLWDQQCRIRDAGGGYRVILSRGVPVRGEDGVIHLWVGVHLDITKRTSAEEALHDVSEVLRAIFKNAPLPIWVLDLEGRVRMWNTAAESMYGWSSGEVESKSLPTVPEALSDEFETLLERVKKGETIIGFETRRRRADGILRDVSLSLAGLRGRKGKLTGVFAILADVTDRKQRDEALRQQKQLRTLAVGLLNGQEDERRRVSRELHDDLNQRLAFLSIEADTLQQELPEAFVSLRERVIALRERLGELSDDIRRLAHALHPSMLEHLGVVSALRELCAQVSRHGSLRVRLTSRSVPEQLPPEIALCLFRVSQECLQNALRHSGASSARVSLRSANDELLLSIEDTGVGFDPAVVRKGLGIVSMEERVRCLSGTVQVSSRPGKGARIDVRLPLPVRGPAR